MPLGIGMEWDINTFFPQYFAEILASIKIYVLFLTFNTLLSQRLQTDDKIQYSYILKYGAYQCKSIMAEITLIT